MRKKLKGGMEMTKADLVDLIASQMELTKKDVDSVVTTLFHTMDNTLKNGEKVKISNFGTFELKLRKQRNRVNPRTKEIVNVPEHHVVAFKPSKKVEKL